MSKATVGQTVEHPTHGSGEVIRLVRGGRYLMVKFAEGITWQVKPAEVALGPVPTQPVAVQVKPEPDNTVLQILEALRLGVVPSAGSQLTTVGRERELAMIRDDLADAERGGSARVLLGDYGTGKTHMLECTEALAHERNFITTRVVLDDEEVSPSHPKRVYRELVRRLHYPDKLGVTGLEPLLEAAAELPGFLSPSSPHYHRYLSPAVAYHRELRPGTPLRAELLDWLEGHPGISNLELEKSLRAETRLRSQRLYALMDFRPWAHLYAYLVGGISWLARQVGYTGLAILFDEAEFYALLNSSGKEFAEVLFGYYAAAALGRERVEFDLDAAPRGGHAVHRGFPPIYSEGQQPIYCLFAMTEDPLGVNLLKRILGEERIVPLVPLGLEDYQELCRRVVDLYKRAYPDFTVGAEVQNPMGQVVYRGVERGVFGNPRQVLKFVMDLLDYSRLRRDQIGDYIKEVMARLRGE